MLCLYQQVWCSNFPQDSAAWILDRVKSDCKDSLELPEHLEANGNLSIAVKAAEKFKHSDEYHEGIGNGYSGDELISAHLYFWELVTDDQAQAYEDYKDVLKSRICGDENVLKYSVPLLELVDAWILHDYLFVWEGGYGKVILTFDYSKTPTQVNIIKLWKNPSQRRWGIWNLIDEAEWQKSFYNFYLQYNNKPWQNSTKICVPELYDQNSKRWIASFPEKWYLTMEYAHGETIENLLYLAEYYDECFSQIKDIITSWDQEDEYITDIIIPKLTSMGIDYKRAKAETLIRLLNKQDILYLLKLHWIKVSPKENKVAFTKESLKKSLIIFFKINNSKISNPESLVSESFWEYQNFIKAAKKQWLEHKDLNTSNIMIDYKDAKVHIWIIDYGTTDDKHLT